MSTNFWSYALHAVAGIVIVSAPYLTAGVPLAWQSMTVGAILALVFKWAHDYAGY